MKINKKQLRRIIREEMNLLNEHRFGAGSIGFVSWKPNERPDFAKSYGRDAKVVWDHGRYANVREQGMPAATSDPVESAYQELKFSGAYKDLQTELHDSMVAIEQLFNEHSDMMVQADQGSLLDDLQEVLANLDNLRQTFSALR